MMPEEDRLVNDLGIEGIGDLGNVGLNAAGCERRLSRDRRSHPAAADPDREAARRSSDPKLSA